MIQKNAAAEKKRVCASCADKVTVIDYKDISKLRRYVSERKDPSQKNHRKLCKASESFNNSYQKSKTYRSYALYTGLIKSIKRLRMENSEPLVSKKSFGTFSSLN